MKRFSFTAAAALAVLLLGAPPGSCDRLRGAVMLEYGTTSNAFGLSSPGFFNVPYQGNSSSDFVLSGRLEYIAVRRWPLDVGIAVKGAFAFSDWNLGAPGVTDTAGYYYPYDQVHIGAEWWALAAMGTAHLHLGPIVTLDGAIGYGPYGYVNVSYYDDDGIVAGPVTQGSSIFPQNAWSLDWSAGFSFGFYFVSFLIDAGMMGPDFVAGLGMDFSL